MTRQKKESRRVNLMMDRTIYEQVSSYAEEKGQTFTMAVERLLTKALADEEKKTE